MLDENKRVPFSRRTILMVKNSYLTAQEAATELGISLDTLYAYVSRGLYGSDASDGQKRSRWYPLEDVQRLKKHKGEYRHPDKVAAGAMQASTPVMESAITMITDDRFYYRGHYALGRACRRLNLDRRFRGTTHFVFAHPAVRFARPLSEDIPPSRRADSARSI